MGKVKAKSANQATKANGTAEGLLFPGKLIPLSVYGCWLLGRWKEIESPTNWFSCKNGVVTHHVRGVVGLKDRDEEAGHLPEGWGCEEIFHHGSRDSGLFVGRSEDIDEAKRLQEKADDLDIQLGRMLHHPNAN